MSQIVMENPLQYRSSMQAAALTFLEQHQGEHLDDDLLSERTINHLVEALEVPAFMAPRLVDIALGQLRNRTPVIGVDLANGPDAHLVVLVHCSSGQRAVIPRRILSESFLAQANPR